MFKRCWAEDNMIDRGDEVELIVPKAARLRTPPQIFESRGKLGKVMYLFYHYNLVVYTSNDTELRMYICINIERIFYKLYRSNFTR